MCRTLSREKSTNSFAGNDTRTYKQISNCDFINHATLWRYVIRLSSHRSIPDGFADRMTALAFYSHLHNAKLLAWGFFLISAQRTMRLIYHRHHNVKQQRCACTFWKTCPVELWFIRKNYCKFYWNLWIIAGSRHWRHQHIHCAFKWSGKIETSLIINLNIAAA